MPDIEPNALTNENIERLQTLIAYGDRQEAIRHMTYTMGVDAARAIQAVDLLLAASGKPGQASPQALGHQSYSRGCKLGLVDAFVCRINFSCKQCDGRHYRRQKW